ncbi:MAG: APC family permease [Beijerinckiaceae bacterium]|nr:APC family permease [Beijerinckiaceae bacterium]
MDGSLKKGALGFLDTLIMAIAGSAPAYSITVSTAALIAAAGASGPAALWTAALPMLGITIAFAQLNRWQPAAGAAYVWVGRAMHPALGFLAGWSLLSLSAIFNVAAALPAGQATLGLIAPHLSHDALWATGVGALWFLGVLAIVTIGITASARTQAVLTLLEVAAIVLVCGLAISNAAASPAAAFSWEWFSPSAFGSFHGFSAAMLIALFYYFGWDVSANLAEETAGANWAAGLACILAVVTIVALFLLAQVAVQMALDPSEIAAHGGNLLPALGEAALPPPWRAIAVLAILVSAIATIETQLLQCTRLLFAMARDGAIGEPMGRLHPRFQTPWLAGFAVAAFTLLLFAGSAAVPSIGALMADLISAIGVQIACYYSLAGFACAWHFRKAADRGWKTLFFAVIIPLVSALIVASAGIYQLPFLGWRVSVLSIGSILAGAVPFWYYRRRYRARLERDQKNAA